MAWFFNAPAGLQDFTDPQNWHQTMVDETKAIIRACVAQVLGKKFEDVTAADIVAVAPTLAYVNPAATPPPADAETIAIAPWGGFPRAVERKGPWALPPDPDDADGNYRAAEHIGSEDASGWVDLDGNPLDLPVRDRQDEYVEWVMRRNTDGKVSKAVFVAEGWDYFIALFNHDEQQVVEIYRDFTETATITADDLRAPNGLKLGTQVYAEKGGFNPRNSYNIRPGIVHLSHNANALGAEVNLAGVSALARKDRHGATLPTGNSERLLCCSLGGNPNRNSDPLIGEQAYAQVLAKKRFTLADPVGLYIASVEEQRLTLPSGDTVPREWWKVIRGQDLWSPGGSRTLRLELEVPAGEGLVVGDLLVDGNPVKYGSQLAQLLAVHLFVTRWDRDNDSIGPVVGCAGTCCRRTGKQELFLSRKSGCPSGFALAFPDLIAPAAGPGAFLGVPAESDSALPEVASSVLKTRV